MYDRIWRGGGDYVYAGNTGKRGVTGLAIGDKLRGYTNPYALPDACIRTHKRKEIPEWEEV